MAVDVIVGVTRSGERPLVLISPVVVTHNEYLDGRLGGHSVVDAFQPIVIPAKVDLLHIDNGVVAKINGSWISAVSDQGHPPAGTVRPWSDHDPLPGAGFVRFSALADLLVVGQRAPHEDVVPAVHAQNRNP